MRKPFRRLAAHQIQANKGCESPSNLIFVDTETVRQPSLFGEHEVERFRLCCAVHLRLERGKVTRRHELYTAKQSLWWVFAEHWYDPRRPTWIWAHNLGFDATTLGLWRQIDLGNYRLARACIEDPPTILQTWAGDQKVWWCDSLNWFRCPLSELGESLGLPKLPMPERSAPDEDWFPYCMRDVQIVERAILSVIAWCREHDLGTFRPTSPAQAMQAYRHRFGPRYRILANERSRDGNGRARTVTRVLPVLHGDPDVRHAERASYYGGQCECYRLGRVEGPIYHLDITHLYPAVMAGGYYPCRLVDVRQGLDPLQLMGIMSEQGVIAHVLLDTDHPYPLRCPDGIVRYVAGRYWTDLAGPELLEAIEDHAVQDHGNVLVYDMADLFSEYVEYFWRLRRTYERSGNLAYAMLAKLMNNSLYGKFGQRAFRWRERHDVQAVQPWGQWVQRDPVSGEYGSWRAIGRLVQQEQHGGEAAHAFPAICAYVTSRGRHRMRQLKQVAGFGHYHYQDTDSLHVDQVGYDALMRAGEIRDCELGYLRLVETASWGIYHGLRDYQLEDRCIVAGVPARGERIGVGRWQADRFDGLASLTASGPAEAVPVRPTIIEYDRVYRHGQVQPDGRVVPYRMPCTF